MSDHRVYPNVRIGPNARIGDYVVLGEPPGDAEPGELETVIGANAVIRSHSVIYAGARIGDDFQSGHGVLIREDTVLGDRVKVWSQAVIYHHCTIGDDVTVHLGAAISEFSEIESGAWIGPRALFTSVPHPGCPKAKECWKGPTIRRGVIVGGNAVILPDLVLAERCFVSAGAVVTRDVEAEKIVFGNPARVVGNVFTTFNCPYDLIERPYEREDEPEAEAAGASAVAEVEPSSSTA